MFTWVRGAAGTAALHGGAVGVFVMLAWHAHTDAVTSLAFVPGGGLLSTGTDGHLRHWDTTSGSSIDALKFADSVSRYTAPTECALLNVVTDASGRYAAVGLRAEGVDFIDLTSFTPLKRMPSRKVLSLVSAADGLSLFVAHHRPEAPHGRPIIAQVRFGDFEVVAVSEALRSSAVSGVAVSPDGLQVVAGQTRLSWPSGRIAGSVPLLSGHTFAVSPDGDKVFSSMGTRLAVWGLQVGVLRQKLKGHVAPITGLTTTPDGRKLWTCSLDATVRQWDVDSYRCTQCYGLKVGPLGCVAVSPDGLTAAAGSVHNGHIAVWDLD